MYGKDLKQYTIQNKNSAILAIGFIHGLIPSYVFTSYGIYRGLSVSLQLISISLLGYFAYKQHRISVQRSSKALFELVRARKSVDYHEGLHSINLTLKNSGKGHAEYIEIEGLKLEYGRKSGEDSQNHGYSMSSYIPINHKAKGRLNPGETREIAIHRDTITQSTDHLRKVIEIEDEKLVRAFLTVKSKKCSPQSLESPKIVPRKLFLSKS